MRQISPVPEGGWLSYIYKETIAEMFPDNFLRDERSGMFSAGKLFYLETLRTIFADQEEKNGFSPLLSMQFLAPEEIEEEPSREEYLHFVEYCKSHYLIEFMRIGKEITPYNTVGHICGVPAFLWIWRWYPDPRPVTISENTAAKARKQKEFHICIITIRISS